MSALVHFCIFTLIWSLSLIVSPLRLCLCESRFCLHSHFLVVPKTSQNLLPAPCHARAADATPLPLRPLTKISLNNLVRKPVGPSLRVIKWVGDPCQWTDLNCFFPSLVKPWHEKEPWQPPQNTHMRKIRIPIVTLCLCLCIWMCYMCGSDRLLISLHFICRLTDQ